MRGMRKLISDGTDLSVAKHGGYVTDRKRPHIFINSIISRGVVGAIGRRHEIELTLEQATKLHDHLGRVIEDINYALEREERSKR